MADIRIERISKTYPGGKTPAVRDVSLAVGDNEFMVLLGPSGCGKTTLLRMIAGLEYPDSGRIFIGDRDVTDLPPRKRRFAMVFQSYAVFPHMTVFDNIAFGLRMHRRPGDEVKRRVERAAGMLQLEPYLGRYPAQLSGGQRQRVAVARAIVMEPPVLLMDEPLSNLDALLRLQFRAELKKLVSDVQTTTVYVTHDQVEALSLGDRIAVMRDGQIQQVAEPMVVYDRPATHFVGSFIGNPPMNFLRGVADRTNGQMSVKIGGQTIQAPPSVAEVSGQDEVLVGIRAENILASAEAPARGALRADTVVVEPLGSHLLLTTDVEGQVVKVVTRTDFPARAGQPIWLQPEPDKLRWLRSADGAAMPVG
ncbi:MAG TPA: ABC transporter ATP-binding protein [Chloroflexota bacterium]|jgi:multiple sugar transport system ATP-binding protein|nr:ABC transporter ATP-binding protein [Chloroflexota bacterium]